MTAQESLLPCPFCGSHAETDFIPEHSSYAIECYSIGCAARVIKETAEDAIAAWNRRAPAAQAQRVPSPDRNRTHQYRPDKKYPWFCDFCGYAKQDQLMHGITQEKQG